MEAPCCTSKSVNKGGYNIQEVEAVLRLLVPGTVVVVDVLLAGDHIVLAVPLLLPRGAA